MFKMNIGSCNRPSQHPWHSMAWESNRKKNTTSRPCSRRARSPAVAAGLEPGCEGHGAPFMLALHHVLAQAPDHQYLLRHVRGREWSRNMGSIWTTAISHLPCSTSSSSFPQGQESPRSCVSIVLCTLVARWTNPGLQIGSHWANRTFYLRQRQAPFLYAKTSLTLSAFEVFAIVWGKLYALVWHYHIACKLII